MSVLNPTAKHDKIEPHTSTTSGKETASLEIVSDEWCQFYAEGKKKARYLLRRIEAKRLEDDQTLVFITNTADLSAEQVTQMYKSRWEIEVFFKFIKQLLNFKHLLNRTENGIKVVLYVTMIAAVLLAVYKRSNKMSGYKIAMLKMSIEIEEALVKQLITLCGGDPDKLYGLLNAKNT